MMMMKLCRIGNEGDCRVYVHVVVVDDDDDDDMVYIHVNDDMLRSVFMNAGNSSNDDRSDDMTVGLPTQFTFDS
ncbi:hypothetical protein Tco_1409748 [Tanacetum coccineum]